MQLVPTDSSWAQQFAAERDRLAAELGWIADGGMAEPIIHVGATAVPGVPARPTIDVALGVFPFPPSAAVQRTLDALGYAFAGDAHDGLVQRWDARSGAFRLHVSPVGDDPLQEMALVRDFLRADAASRAAYAQRKAQLAAAGDAAYDAAHTALLDDTLAAAKAWWVRSQGFGPVHAVARELDGFERPWYISSGWALELLLGRVTRLHHDVDVVVARADQLALQQHMRERGWKWVTPYGGALEPWRPHMRLELPRHQALAFKDDGFVDFLLSEIEDGIWRYRREPSIVCHVDQIALRSPDGIPFLAPELVLLFKSKNTSNKQERTQDQRDYEQIRELLEPERRAWLRWALLRCDPTHAWIAELG